MKTFARIEDNIVAEIIRLPEGVDIGAIFHPDLAKNILSCSSSVHVGWRHVDGNIVPPLAADLSIVKLEIKRLIDEQAELQRLRYITAGVGQSMTYQQKIEEATAILLDSSPDPDDYPMLSAEVGITAPTLAEVGDVIVRAYRKWQHIGAAIERVRLGAKVAVDEAKTFEAAKSALAAVIWP